MRRALVVLAALALVACGRFAPAGEEAVEDEPTSVGGGVSVPSTAPGLAGAPPGARPGDTVPPSQPPPVTDELAEGSNFRKRVEQGFELTVAAGPEEGGDGLILQLTFKNVSDRTLHHDPNQQVLFEIVRPDGKGFRWTDRECRAGAPLEGTTGGPVAIEPGDEGRFLARYPTARQTRASSAPPECYLPAGEYVLRGFLDSCPESAWVSEDGGQPYCDPAKVVRLSVDMPLKFD